MMVIFHQIYVFPVTSPPFLYWFWASFWPCLSHLPIVICILGRWRGTGLLIFGPILSTPSDKSMYPLSFFTLSRNFPSGPQNTSGKLMYDGHFHQIYVFPVTSPPSLSLLVLGFFLALRGSGLPGSRAPPLPQESPGSLASR